MNFKSFNQFVNENQHGLGRKVGSELISYRIPTREEALKLRIGDQVLDKSRQFLGVGTLNSLSKDGKIATVQFYDSLKGSTYGNQGKELDVASSGKLDYYDKDSEGDEIYNIHISRLMAVSATDESSGIYIPGAVGAISTNTADQETGVKPEDAEDEEDEQDRFNASIINKFAAQVAGKPTAFVSRNQKSRGRGIQEKTTELDVGTAVEMEHTKDPKEAEKIAKDHLAEDPNYYIKLYKAGLIDEPNAIKLVKNLMEGGFGDNQIAGQPVFTQSKHNSKEGYQDAMYYEETDELHDDDCDCVACQPKTRVSVTEGKKL